AAVRKVLAGEQGANRTRAMPSPRREADPQLVPTHTRYAYCVSMKKRRHGRRFLSSTRMSLITLGLLGLVAIGIGPTIANQLADRGVGGWWRDDRSEPAPALVQMVGTVPVIAQAVAEAYAVGAQRTLAAAIALLDLRTGELYSGGD